MLVLDVVDRPGPFAKASDSEVVAEPAADEENAAEDEELDGRTDCVVVIEAAAKVKGESNGDFAERGDSLLCDAVVEEAEAPASDNGSEDSPAEEG